MTTKIVIDTGPLVAFLNRHDQYHDWTRQQLEVLVPPFFTCEAVIAEACFLLRNLSAAQLGLLELVQRDLVKISFNLHEEIPTIKKLMQRYHSTPMSLADACLVRLSEQIHNSKVLTLDRDFHIYRKHGRQVVPSLMPF